MCSYWDYTRHYSGDEGGIPQKACKEMAASIGKIEEFDRLAKLSGATRTLSGNQPD